MDDANALMSDKVLYVYNYTCGYDHPCVAKINQSASERLML